MSFVYLMTKNAGKLKAARSVFDEYDIDVRSCDLEIPEIQADTSIEIARAAVEEAYKTLKAPVIREDHSFFVDALGMPGPYMAYFEKKISLDQLLGILEDSQNRGCHWEIATAYVDLSGNVHEFVYTVQGIFEKEGRGQEGSTWMRAVRFPEEVRTLTEYPEEERLHVWNKNYQKIAEYIVENKKVLLN